MPKVGLQWMKNQQNFVWYTDIDSFDFLIIWHQEGGWNKFWFFVLFDSVSGFGIVFRVLTILVFAVTNFICYVFTGTLFTM